MAKVAPLQQRPRWLSPARRVALAAALACAFSAAAEPSWARVAGSAPRVLLSFALTPQVAAATPAPGEEDTDEDGIPDNEDACKRVKGVASETPRLNGCPPPPPAKDSDGDGVADDDDACPKKKGVAASDPQLNGCPPPPPPKDSDGDGIPDKQDACPRKNGVSSDDPKLNGCPAHVASGIPRASAVPGASAIPGGPAQLTFAGFRSFDDGSSLVFVELSGPVTVDVKKGHGTLEYTLENTQVPMRNNRNPLLTGDFSTIVRRATIAQRNKAVAITIALKADVLPEHRLVQRGGATVLEIQLPTTPPATSGVAPGSPNARKGTPKAP